MVETDSVSDQYDSASYLNCDLLEDYVDTGNIGFDEAMTRVNHLESSNFGFEVPRVVCSKYWHCP